MGSDTHTDAHIHTHTLNTPTGDAAGCLSGCKSLHGQHPKNQRLRLNIMSDVSLNQSKKDQIKLLIYT